MAALPWVAADFYPGISKPAITAMSTTDGDICSRDQFLRLLLSLLFFPGTLRLRPRRLDGIG
jgi:hypothetical protein